MKLLANKIKENFYSQKEILGFLNNAVLAQKQVSDYAAATRQTKLRAYTEALLEAPFEHLDEQLMTPEELCFILSSAALYVYTLKVTKK